MNNEAHRRHLELMVNPRDLSTAQQKGETLRRSKLGKWYVHHYVKKEVKRSHDLLLAEIRRTSGGLPRMEDKADTVWFLSVVFVYDLGSKPKKFLGEYKLTYPDGDNLHKLLQDVLTESGYYWHNDSQVQIEGIVRRYVTQDEQPRILVTLRNRKEAFARPISPSSKDEE